MDAEKLLALSREANVPPRDTATVMLPVSLVAPLAELWKAAVEWREWVDDHGAQPYGPEPAVVAALDALREQVAP